MKVITKIFFLLLIISSTLLPQKKVYVAVIENEIDLGLAPYVRRVISEAEKENVDAILPKPPSTASTGVMQQSDAATAVNNPALSHFFSDAVFVSITYPTITLYFIKLFIAVTNRTFLYFKFH